MSKAAAAGAAAHDATVVTDDESNMVIFNETAEEADRAALTREAVAADEAVALIEAKMDGWQQSLDDARAAAEAAHQRLDEAGN